MAMLKQMGGHFSLIGQSNKPLYKEQSSSPQDADLIDEVMINSVRIDNDFFNDIVCLEEYAFNIELCNEMNEFLLLTKMDFMKESSIKARLFGRQFENMDCPDLTKCYLRAITLSQTFNNNFVFVGKTKNIPCTRLHADKGHAINTTIPLCELSKICLMMMTFIHKEIMVESQMKDMFKDHVLEQIGTRVFFMTG